MDKGIFVGPVVGILAAVMIVLTVVTLGAANG
jgi:hypothetical protein